MMDTNSHNASTLEQVELPQEQDPSDVESLSASDCVAVYRKLLIESESLKLNAEFQAALGQRGDLPNEAHKKVAALSVMMHKLRARLHYRFGLSAHDEAIKMEPMSLPKVGDRVYLEENASFADDEDGGAIPAGWYILHRVCNVSGVIDSPDALVTLCKENNEPGSYITALASKIHLQEPMEQRADPQDYDGSYVENHFGECGISESDCSCGLSAARAEASFGEVRQPHGEFTTSVVAARQELILKLVEDKVSQWISNGEYDLGKIATTGFPGFEKLSISELVQCACDARLDQRDPVVASLLHAFEIGMVEQTTPHDRIPSVVK